MLKKQLRKISERNAEKTNPMHVRIIANDWPALNHAGELFSLDENSQLYFGQNTSMFE